MSQELRRCWWMVDLVEVWLGKQPDGYTFRYRQVAQFVEAERGLALTAAERLALPDRITSDPA